jgi:hypothetical protein
MPTKTARSPQTDSHAATAVLQVAERLYSMEPEWVVFFREVLGVDGIVRRTFSDSEGLSRFECSPQYARIREMLDGLRARQNDRQADQTGQVARTRKHRRRQISALSTQVFWHCLRARCLRARTRLEGSTPPQEFFPAGRGNGSRHQTFA